MADSFLYKKGRLMAKKQEDQKKHMKEGRQKKV